MNLRNFKTSNPVFNGYFWKEDISSSKTMSVAGIFIKSMIGIIIIATITSYLWKLSEEGMRMRWFTLGGMFALL